MFFIPEIWPFITSVRTPTKMCKVRSKSSKEGMQETKRRPPTCWNCNGKHTANYRGCPYYIDLCKEKIDHSRETRNKSVQKSVITMISTPIPQPITHKTTKTTETKSYANVTKHQMCGHHNSPENHKCHSYTPWWMISKYYHGTATVSETEYQNWQHS